MVVVAGCFLSFWFVFDKDRLSVVCVCVFLWTLQLAVTTTQTVCKNNALFLFFESSPDQQKAFQKCWFLLVSWLVAYPLTSFGSLAQELYREREISETTS